IRRRQLSSSPTNLTKLNQIQMQQHHQQQQQQQQQQQAFHHQQQSYQSQRIQQPQQMHTFHQYNSDIDPTDQINNIIQYNNNRKRNTRVLNTPHHTRRFTTLISDNEPDTTYLWGYLLFFSTMFCFTVSMYALVASNYMPM